MVLPRRKTLFCEIRCVSLVVAGIVFATAAVPAVYALDYGIIDGTAPTTVTIEDENTADAIKNGTITIQGTMGAATDRLTVNGMVGNESGNVGTTVNVGGGSPVDSIHMFADRVAGSSDPLGSTTINIKDSSSLTTASITGNIAVSLVYNTFLTATVVNGDVTINNNNGTVDLDTVMGNLALSNKSTASITTVGDAANGTVTSLILGSIYDSNSINVDIGSIVGTTTVNSATSINSKITLGTSLSPTDLGSTAGKSVITLGSEGGSLKVNLRNIVGGANENNSTTVNLDTSKVTLASTNAGTTPNLADVNGYVTMKLIGGSANDLSLGTLTAGSVFTFDAEDGAGSKTVVFVNGIEGGQGSGVTTINLNNKAILANNTNIKTGGNFALNLNGTTVDQNTTISEVGSTTAATSLTLNGTNTAATTTITTLTGGSSAASATALHVGENAKTRITNGITGHVTISNTNRGDGAVWLDVLANGAVVKVGTSNGTGSASHADAASSVYIGAIQSGSTVEFSSIDGDEGRVLVAGSGIADNATLNLKNIVFQIATNTGNKHFAAATVSMDSTAGTSHMVADTGASTQDLIFAGRTPTVTVGSGGDVIIDTHTLKYQKVLKTAASAGVAENIYFDDSSANSNRMIFRSSSTNNFERGVEIDGGRFEFEGATTFTAVSTTPSTTNYMKNAEIRFTGLDETGGSPSLFTIDGTAANNTIDATATDLHLNKAVNITYRNQGAFTNLERVVIGDEYKAYATFGDGTNHTVVTAKDLTVGTHGGEISNLSIGGAASPSFTDGLHITSSAELAGKTLVDGTLSIFDNGTDATVTVTGMDGGFVLTLNSSDSTIEDGTKVQIANDVYNAMGFNKIHFLSADPSAGTSLDALIADLASHVTVDTSNLAGNVEFVIDEYGDIYYQNSSGGGPLQYVPHFARPMVVAAEQLNPVLGLYLRGGGDPVTSLLTPDQYRRELTQIMGNTLSSSMSMVQSGATLAFGRLNTTVPRPFGESAARSGEALPSLDFRSFVCTDNRRANGLWATPGYTNQSVDGDYNNGYGDFDVKGFGVNVGYDRWLNDVFRIGGFFSYGRPELDGDYQNIDADDVQTGLYGQGLLPGGVIMNAGFALGWQDYTSKRSIRLNGLPEFNQDLRADYNGKSIGFALEISRPVALENNIVLRPALGYTYQRVHLDEVGETSSLAAGPNNLAQRIAGSRFATQQVRLGTDIGWTNDRDTLSLSGRAYWVANVGDKQPTGTARFIHAGFGALPFNVVGARYSDHMANLGASIVMRPAAVRGLSVGVEYDLLWGGRSTNHNVGVKFGFAF